MTELAFFLIVGMLALASAVFMLWSDNPVHSALALIVTMGCIAFLFLLLNAPFLAMIQITVYTGAIMVLFLFVIMLLGAETLQASEASPDTPRFRWYIPTAIVLVVALLLIVGIVFGQVNLGLQADTTAPPQVRILNAAPDAGTVDVYANDQLIVSAVAFNDASAYIPLAAGDYTLRVQPTNGDAVTTNVTLAKGTQQTLIDYGGSPLDLSLIADDNSAVADDRSARITVFNADLGIAALRLVDLSTGGTITTAPVLIAGLVPGQASAPITVPEGAVNWGFVDAAAPSTELYHLENYSLQLDMSDLFVMTQGRVFNGTPTGYLRSLAIPVLTNAEPSFGGPRAIGLELFTNYLLVFQLLAVLLLAAMVGAIVLTHRELKSVTRRVGGRRRVSRPLVNVIAAQVGHDVTDSGESGESETVPELQEPVGE